MSADNGIYILETPTRDGKVEYRVEEAQAIDNIYYSEVTGNYDASEDEQIIMAREYFDKSPVFDNEADALKYAFKLEKECYILEYGISSLVINKPF